LSTSSSTSSSTSTSTSTTSSTTTSTTTLVPECNDGIDNDNDGFADFGSDIDCGSLEDDDESGSSQECIPGQTRNCGVSDVGECKLGKQTCGNNGLFGSCVGNINPVVELCDSLDNDCDGSSDEIFSNLGNSCSIGVGACRDNGVFVCRLDGSGTQCNAVPGIPSNETCDGSDNDCDGNVDEGGNNLCNNRLFCDGNEICRGVLGCQDGTAPNINDGVLCTIDSCNENTDTIVHTPNNNLCDDNITCTADMCTNSGCVNEEIDNDNDGFSICSNLDCNDTNPNINSGANETCDSIDNDCDSIIDEFACQCNDRTDNDEDGFIDLSDLSCSSPLDNDEKNPTQECNDNIDNDDDGFIDMNDAGCTTSQDTTERTQCQDRKDNDGDGAVDMNDFSCRGVQDDDERFPLAQCQDRIDNDNDGRIDLDDFQCTSQQDNNESIP
ncbi:MAG: putative metal-binding motif-containing protein, partial [Nanoarchaeota archaeon]